MRQKKEWWKWENCILTLLVVSVNMIVMGVCFDFFYDLNDDTMMLDIMSGAYSGTPDGHNMQTLYPLGALIALCYKVCGTIPWYGLFLCLCQFGCLYLIGVRLCSLGERCGKAGSAETLAVSAMCAGRKILRLGALSLLVWGVCLSHLVNVQYTVTCAMLSAAAIFLFLTTPDTESSKRFIRSNIPSMVLVIAAYQLRSEMLLLTFPFICLAGLYRLTEEKKLFGKDTLIRYGSVLGIMLAGMLISRGIDYAAYSSGQWKDFLRFFEARTTVYDFYQELIMEDAWQEALEELGVPPSRQTLLRNYNYGLDDGVDSQFLITLADYATDTVRKARDWKAIVKKQVYRYYYRTLRGGDSPYSTLLLWMYAAVFVAGICASFLLREAAASGEEKNSRKMEKIRESMQRFGLLWQAVLLTGVRSAVWMFILLRGRDPERITHSLYLVEFALLAAMLIRARHRRPGGTEILRSTGIDTGRHCAGSVLHGVACGIVLIMAVSFCLITGKGMIKGIPALRAQQELREQVNENWYAIDEYCRERDENFYFEDVYSTVSFSRRIFDSAGRGYANYDILGGWMCGSPLYYDKLRRYGITSVQEALIGQENVYLILADQEVKERGLAWIEDCYAAQGIETVAEKTDRIGEGYAVYRIMRIQ
ncbi:MAG: hypothetical protein K2P48_03075 [Lachnospiraceae bacterium]|nr:hypothetical protein [Lachnospiraceae bacterium]